MGESIAKFSNATKIAGTAIFSCRRSRAGVNRLSVLQRILVTYLFGTIIICWTFRGLTNTILFYSNNFFSGIYYWNKKKIWNNYWNKKEIWNNYSNIFYKWNKVEYSIIPINSDYSCYSSFSDSSAPPA